VESASSLGEVAVEPPVVMPASVLRLAVLVEVVVAVAVARDKLALLA